MRRWLASFLGLGFALAAFADDDPAQPKPPLPPPAADTIEYARDIKPIFDQHCIQCHGPNKQRSGLRLDAGAEVLKGGNEGPILTAGKSAESALIHLVAGWEPDRRMPPDGEPLNPTQIAKLRAWIDQGAKIDAADAPAVTARPPSSDHWSFQPISTPPVPEVKAAKWARTPIDRFILARLEQEGVAPSSEADPITLMRRLYLDLLGLPPRPEEIEDFLNDRGEGAYERLVDRLLASPHYGERWGRHWLDLARYADSDGYEKDLGRPWAWRYRHWVIDAFNRDLPFDQFTLEQLAGDLLPSPTPEQLAATGFHRNTLTNLEGGTDAEEFRVAAVYDRVHTTATVFLGLTMQCAQCHDHKYDPLSQREFYQMFAFFNSDEEANLDAPLPGERAAHAFRTHVFEQFRPWWTVQVEAYRSEHIAKSQEQWEANLKVPELRKLPEPLRALLLLEPGQRTPEQQKQLAEHHAKVDPLLKKHQGALAKFDAGRPQMTQAQTLRLGKPRPTQIHIRGDFLRKGVAVTANAPGFLPPLPNVSGAATVASADPAAAFEGQPSRLDLARWLVAPEQPLTARVMVNWVWTNHFGRGLVGTPEDFGTRGERPSHPELVEWLASEVRTSGWSVKKLHRLIVTSAVYRQSAASRPELHERDSLNVWLARQHRLRLEAEIVRDGALAASGLLVRRIGGPSVRPPQPPGISELTYANSAKWVESKGPDRYRRGMYIWFQRTSPYPMLVAFDAPESNVCTVKRERTNTPLQALTLLNDVVFVEAAQALGRRLLHELPGADQDRARLERLYRLTLARLPTEREVELLTDLLADMRRLAREAPEVAKLAGTVPASVEPAEAAAWVALARAVLNLDEFIMRE
ncbi:MAG TPA: PSD1 and planctomycete cytochrome C domain-containing protein [Gemmatales bacterium]|nr:PSD1 and planctomycete cytochrome C domain-containing protein [Gemmatales bacterium]